jgi:hypothetical protein
MNAKIVLSKKPTISSRCYLFSIEIDAANMQYTGNDLSFNKSYCNFKGQAPRTGWLTDRES